MTKNADETKPTSDLCEPVCEKPSETAPTDTSGELSGTPWLTKDDGKVLATEFQPLQPCNNCGMAIPVGSASCPGCGRFAPAHPSARRRRKGDVHRLLQEIHDAYRPSTVTLRETARQLADTLAELRVERAGSVEYQRLISVAQTLTAALDASRSAAPIPADLAALTDDQLIERTTTILRGLLDIQASQRQGDALIAAAGASVQTPVDAAAETLESTPRPAPEPICQYCGRVCVGEDHPAFSTMHRHDPEEVKRRRQQATNEMLHQLRKPLPDWYTR